MYDSTTLELIKLIDPLFLCERVASSSKTACKSSAAKQQTLVRSRGVANLRKDPKTGRSLPRGLEPEKLPVFKAGGKTVQHKRHEASFNEDDDPNEAEGHAGGVNSKVKNT